MSVRPRLRGACLHLVAAAALSGCFRDQGFTADTRTMTSSSTSSTSEDPTTTSTSTTTSTTDLPTSSTSTGCLERLWYLDSDTDGFGADDESLLACDQPDGYVPLAGDCAPMDGDVSPAEPEVCDGKDNDCDTGVDEFSPDNPACGGCRTVLGDLRAYYLCSQPLDWPAARLACQAYGPGHDLVVLHSAEEQDPIVAQIHAVPAEAESAWWIGLHDAAVEGTFVWVDGSPGDFTNWLPMEPNDSMAAEDCTQYPATLSGLWNDIDCAVPQFYICEGPL